MILAKSKVFIFINFKIDFRKQWHFFRINKGNCYDMLIVWDSDSVMFFLSNENQLINSSKPN